jgi:hypothetical protein
MSPKEWFQLASEGLARGHALHDVVVGQVLSDQLDQLWNVEW